MGYYKNQLIEEQVEVGDRAHDRRSTYVKPVGVVVISKTIMFTTLTIVWLQFSVTAGLLVWVATR
jgi:hypothetical protein